MGSPPFIFFLHSFEAWCANGISWTKGHVDPVEVPDDLFGRIQTQRWKVWFALDIPLGVNLSLVHLVLVFVVHVAIHVEFYESRSIMRFNFVSFQLNRIATDLL